MIPSFEQRHSAGHRLVANTWGAIGGAAVGVIGNAVMSDGGGGGGGGAGSSSQSRDPWMPLQPWILNNAVAGQNLQNAYTAQPFSALQNQAYANQNNQSAYMRAAVPSLLGQISGQQVGFDRSNPNARPNAFNFNGLMAADQAGKGAAQEQQAGLLSMLNAGQGANANPAANTPQVTPPKPEEGTFTQQANVLSGMTMSGQNPDGSLLGTGGYGTFRYGMPMPQPGTQQYRDMSAYFANGGLDPNNKYGRGAGYQHPNTNPMAYLWTSGDGGYGGAPGQGEGPSSGAPGGAASAGPGGTY